MMSESEFVELATVAVYPQNRVNSPDSMNLNARGFVRHGSRLALLLSFAVTMWCSGATSVGPHHRTWQTTREVARPDGGVDQEASSLVELAGGMNRWDAAAEAWVPASDQVELFQDGAIARRSEYIYQQRRHKKPS